MNNLNSKIKSILLTIAGDNYRELVIIALAWKKTMGDLLSERYKIVKFENNVLFIKAVNHVWLQDFVLYRPVYIEKLRKETNIDVQNIIVSISNS